MAKKSQPSPQPKTPPSATTATPANRANTKTPTKAAKAATSAKAPKSVRSAKSAKSVKADQPAPPNVFQRPELQALIDKLTELPNAFDFSEFVPAQDKKHLEHCLWTNPVETGWLLLEPKPLGLYDPSGLDDQDLQAEVERQLRSRLLMRIPQDWWRSLSSTCLEIYDEVERLGLLPQLYAMTQWELLPDGQRPAPEVEYDALRQKGRDAAYHFPLDDVDSSRSGARILVWLAYGADPVRFGYSQRMTRYLQSEYFWVTVTEEPAASASAGWTLRYNPSPVASLKKYAATLAGPTLYPPVGDKNDGPVGAGPFFVLGGRELKLSPASFLLLKQVWDAEGYSIRVKDLQEALSEEGIVDDNAKDLAACQRSALTRLRKQIEPLGVTVISDTNSVWLEDVKGNRIRDVRSKGESSRSAN
jgi:hypothetical protein